MPTAPYGYVMKGVINEAPYNDVTWRVYGTPDYTGEFSGYTNLINIEVDYTIIDELAGTQAVPLEITTPMLGDVTGNSGATVVTMTGDVTGRTSDNTVVKLQNRSVASTAPVNGEALTWVSANNDWEPSFPTQQNIAIFNSSGTWTCPAGVTLIRVFGVGGGGGGSGGFGGLYSGSVGYGGRGGYGGAGAYASEVMLVVVPGTTYTITIGTGGVGGAGSARADTNPNGGEPGTSTSFGSLYSWPGAGPGIYALSSVTGKTIASLSTAFSTLGVGGAPGDGGQTYPVLPGRDGTDGTLHIGGLSTGGAGGAAGADGYVLPNINTVSGGGGGGGGASNSTLGSPGVGGAGANAGSVLAGPWIDAETGHPGTAGTYGHGGGGGGGGTWNPHDGSWTYGGDGGAGGNGRLIITW